MSISKEANDNNPGRRQEEDLRMNSKVNDGKHARNPGKERSQIKTTEAPEPVVSEDNNCVENKSDTEPESGSVCEFQ